MAGQAFIKSPMGSGQCEIFFKAFKPLNKLAAVKNQKRLSGLVSASINIAENTKTHCILILTYQAWIGKSCEISLLILYLKTFR